MSDPESPDPIHRPLKPILPPVAGGSEQASLRGSPKTTPRPLKPIPPPIISSEERERYDKEREKYEKQQREFEEFQRLSQFRRNLKGLWLQNLASLVELSLLATISLVVYVFFLRSASPTGKWRWSLWMPLIVAMGYILMRNIEGQLMGLLARSRPNRFLDQLFRPNAVRYVVEQLHRLTRRKSNDRANRYLLTNQQKRVTFKDIAFPEQALGSLQRFLEFSKEPQKYQRLGGNPERGILLVGPSGIGKTLAVSALAGEANVPLFRLSEPPSSLSELHDFLDCGPKNAPSILFIDNIDTVARSRSIWPDVQTQNLESMTMALISFLDQQNPNDGVFLVAATNRPDLIDEALIRPGRMTVVEIPYPTLRETEKIIKVFTRKVPLAEDVDISIIARSFLEIHPNCTAAFIAETCNLAATLSAEKSMKVVNQEAFLDALERMHKTERPSERLDRELHEIRSP